MKCQISAREVSQPGREIEMSSVSVSSAYVRRMIELESRGNGDQANALARVSRRIGIHSRAARRLLNGERRDVGSTLVTRIRLAYLDLCEAQVRKLQEEIRTERAVIGEHDDLQNLDQEALALFERVRAAKERLRR